MKLSLELERPTGGACYEEKEKVLVLGMFHVRYLLDILVRLSRQLDIWL